jgi:hypothetical protein
MNNLSDPASASDPAEMMVTNLLADVITKHGPPDVALRVIAKLDRFAANATSSAQRSAPDQADSYNRGFSIQDYDEAVAFAESEIRNGYGTIIPPPRQSARLNQRGEASLGLWVQRSVGLLVALAAVVLGVLLVPAAIRSWNSNHSNTENIVVKPTESISRPRNPSPTIQESVIGIGQEKESIAKNAPQLAPRTELDRTGSSLVQDQGKPSERAIAPPSSPKMDTVDIPKSNSVGNLVPDQEMVKVVDNQLKHLWDRVGLIPQPSIKTEAWLERVSLVTVGRLPTAAEKESFRANKSDLKNLEFVDKLIGSDEFTTHWSELLAEHYLGSRIVGVKKQSEAQRGFVEWIAKSLSSRKFVGDMERELIAGPASLDSDESIGTRNDPASFWAIEMLDRSETEQRDSADQLSKKKLEIKNAGRVGLARQLMRIQGNSSMVCSQCHETDSRNPGISSFLALASRSPTGLDAFWSVPANFVGLTVERRPESQRVLRSAPPSDYFFEDADGRLKIAAMGPPSMANQGTSKKGLKDWIQSSVEPRRAFVEMVWSKVFNQPLVPVFGLNADEGSDERTDLRDLLASQLQMGKRDLGTLVRWMVMSQAFRLELQTMDTPWYLKSSESQIAETQKKVRLFASSAALGTTALESNKLPMNRVATWIQTKRTYDLANQALAQAAANPTSPPKAAKPSKPNYSEEQVRYLVSVSKPYSQISEFASKMASSSMSWPMLLDHAFLVTDCRFPTRTERDEASKLLEALGRERAKALVLVINARLGSH